MADPLYTQLQSTASRLIDRYGKPAVIRRNTSSGPVYNPVLTPTDYAISFVETTASLYDRDSTQILEGDLIGIVSVSGDEAVLKVGDIIIAEGSQFNIVRADPLNPGGLQLLTEIQAR